MSKSLMTDTKVELFKVRDYNLPSTLEGMIAFLEEELKKVPEYFRSVVVVELTYEYDYGDDRKYFLEGSYYRPETKQEAQERLAKNKQQSQAKLEQERAQYLKLKEKFG